MTMTHIFVVLYQASYPENSTKSVKSGFALFLILPTFPAHKNLTSLPVKTDNHILDSEISFLGIRIIHSCNGIDIEG